MRKSAPIEVVVHYPKTKDGWDELGKRVATAHANYVIEKIVVHEAVKGEDGSREQEVEIFYRFIGKID